MSVIVRGIATPLYVTNVETWISGWTAIDADFLSGRSVHLIDSPYVATFVDAKLELSRGIFPTHSLHTQLPRSPLHDIRVQRHPQRTIPHPRESSRVYRLDDRDVRASMVLVDVCRHRRSHRVNVTPNMGPSHDGGM